MSRRRLDQELVSRGLAETRSRAQALVMAGDVRVDGAVCTRAGQPVGDAMQISVAVPPRFVSRGGEKLETALAALGWDVAGANAIDLGACTGGFTDCLLQRGASRVIAVDVGYGQLHQRLRNDPRVHVMERTNARTLTADLLPYAPDLLVADLSFIGLRLVLEAGFRCLSTPWRSLVLVKPQFEAGRDAVPRDGVVRDPIVRRRAVADVARYALDLGSVPVAAFDSGLPGPAGNREYVLAIVSQDHPLAVNATEPDQIARAAVI